jgi:hypothetical protein
MGLLQFVRSGKVSPTRKPVVGEVTVMRTPTAPSPENLRRQLFAAVASGNKEKLTCLCQIHEKSIFHRKLIWANLPKSIRSNPKVLQWYGTGLSAIASFCARRLGKPELMEQLRKVKSPRRSLEDQRKPEHARL